MKKLFYIATFAFIFSVSFGLTLAPSVAVAYDPLSVCNDIKTGEKPAACSAGNSDPITGNGGVLITVANVIAWLGGAVAVIMIIYASFKYVTSGGDQGKIKSAKDIILYAVVGLVVIVASRAIVIFVLNKV